MSARCVECGAEAEPGSTGPWSISHAPDCTEAPVLRLTTMLERAQILVEREAPSLDETAMTIAVALVSIAESLDQLVGIPPCPHCGSRAGATAWDAVEVVDDDPSVWHRRCAACGGVLPEYER